jgi:hypothetical protein
MKSTPLRRLPRRLEYRRQIMLIRQEGLTKTYNRFHDPDETAEDIQKLRDLHVEMDNAVAAAYGWCEPTVTVIVVHLDCALENQD